MHIETDQAVTTAEVALLRGQRTLRGTGPDGNPAEMGGQGELCRKHGVSEQTFYRWKRKYGGLEVSDARRLKALEEENARLKRLVADQALDNQMLRELLRKNW
jgi:putative transposase